MKGSPRPTGSSSPAGTACGMACSMVLHRAIIACLALLVALAALIGSAAAARAAGGTPGSLIAWGDDLSGQCDVPAPNSGFIAVSAGDVHTLGLKSDGSIVAWGDNGYGQCNVPTPNSGFVSVSAGMLHSLGLKSDGSVVAWGDNGYGQCNVPTPNSGFIAVAAGGAHSLGLKSDGSVVAWGNDSYGQCTVPTPNSGFVSVSAGYLFSLGLKSDGSVVGWGANGSGQCTIPTPNSGFVRVSAGRSHSLGLKSDGSVVAWGDNTYGQCNVPTPNSGFVSVGAGEYHSLGLKSDGSVVAWGWNVHGQCDVPTPNSGFAAIAAGGWHSIALRVQDRGVGWGDNTYGQCTVTAPDSGFISIAGGGLHSLGLRSDGSVAAWGDNTWGQCVLPSTNSGFAAVSAGVAHSLGLKSDGSIVAWGANGDHQCDVPAPNSGFMSIAAGGYHCLGLKSDGSIVAWGASARGQCNVPVPNSAFISIAAGEYHSLGLKSDGSILAWGDNSDGQCSVPAPNSGFISIAAGQSHSLGLKSDGSVVAWGRNTDGQCSVPAPNSGFAAVAAGGNHSLGLKSDGAVVAWGRNTDGQCDVPTPNSGFAALEGGGEHSLALRALNLPTMTTTAISNITSTTADSGGNVTSDGGDPVTARGVCWSTNPNPTIADDHTTDGTGTGVFTSELTGLTPGTLYHVRAYATNSVGTAYGSQQDFTTDTIPTVITTSISNVTSTTANSGGNVTNDGGDPVSTRGVCWSTLPNPTIADDHTTDGTGTGVFVSSITSLTPGTLYHVRAYATNSVGTSYGSQEDFTTIGYPKLQTDAASSITATDAILNGRITDTGGRNADSRGFRCRKQGAVSWTEWIEAGSFGTGSYNHTLTGLDPATGYEYQACAHNSAGWAYGGTISFKTSPAPTPVVASVFPSSGPPGTEVTITGERFGSSRGSSAVTVGGMPAQVVSWSGTKIVVVIPEGTQGGAVVVTTSSGGSNTDKTFTVELSAWYLAEGTNAWGFSTYITIENPNNESLHARLTYMDPNPRSGTGRIAERTVTLTPLSQTTVSSFVDIGEVDFSTKVECLEGKSIAVDRTMSWTGTGASCPESHNSVGVTSPSKTWYLPEGSSNHGFETWTLVQNPNATEASLTLTYMTEDAGPVPVSKKIPAYSRATYSMAADIRNHDSSIELTSNVPVIAERSQYRNDRREGSCSIGATTPSTDFYLAEGTTAWGFTTYVLVQNPGSEGARVDITYMTPTGPVDQEPFTMPPNSRRTIKVNDVPGVSSADLSTRVHSDKPIIAERAMYWTCPADSAEVCHDSIGLSQPHMLFMLPDGQTTEDWETWTLVANPNPASVTVRVTYLPQNGGNTVTFTDEIPANTRRTYNMAGAGKAYPDFQGRASILVQSLDRARPVMAERAMYRFSRGCGTDTIGAFED